MGYGYKQWSREYTGEDPAKGVTTLVLDIIENLKFPIAGRGTVPLSELMDRIDGLSGGDETNDAWETRLGEIKKMFDDEEFPEFPDGRVDPKPIVSQLKKLTK